MDRESSDEEDDQQNLILQHHLPHHSPTTFQIDQFNPIPPTTRTNIPQFNKRYLFAILLPLLILPIYFSSHILNFFTTTPTIIVSSPSPNHQIRQSELRALYLLKQQQTSLSTLLNHTNSTLLNTNDLKSSLLNQISLNKEIQHSLLSAHYQSPCCRKAGWDLSTRRTIEWKPRPNKYLFAICVSGQMSNHLICLERHMFFAALLNRVLIIPSSRVDYQYNRVMDIDRVNKCLGRKVVIPFEEFYEMKKRKHLVIGRVLCYFSSPKPCYVDDEHVKKLKALGLAMGKFENVWVEDVKKPKRRTVQDVVAMFSFDDEVIAIGDVFYANVEQDWVMQPGGPLAHKCKTLIEPSRLIMLTAQRFVQTFLGKNFIALHFRRHGFLKFCNAKEQSCFFPIPQAANCISRLVERENTPVIYLSTDAADSETGLLQSLIVVNGKTVPLIKRPSRNSAEKWDALLYRHGLEGDSQVEAMLDKTICAMSSVFIGAPGSTFTEDIRRLRKDWGSASLCDEYLCQGELPNFIADDE